MLLFLTPSHQTHQYLASVRKADNPFLVCVCVFVMVCVCVCVWLTATKASRKTRGELSKNADADYYGYTGTGMRTMESLYLWSRKVGFGEEGEEGRGGWGGGE